MRSFLFNVAYYVISILYVILATLCLILPGKKAVNWVVRRYALRMRQALRWIAGVKLEVRGLENVPAEAIIAAKHHSWFDGYCAYSTVDNLAFVTGNHLEKVPLLRGVLKKLGAIVVDSCGGQEARDALSQSASAARAEGKRILIYPEGHLSAAGTFHRYRSGVYFMQRDFGLPVIPVATNLGVFAPQQDRKFRPGTAVLEFLPAIEPGLDKGEFMARLQATIEANSNRLIAEATGEPLASSTLVDGPWGHLAQLT